MSITLYGHPLSNNTRKVQWALRELGLDATFTVVDLMAGEQRQAAITAMNPNARVPILRDGDLILTETQAILLHLAERSRALMPADAAGRARVVQWLFWVTSDLQMQVQHPWYAKLLSSFGRPLDASAHAAQVAAAETPLRVLDGALAGHTWLAGEAFSVADIAAAEPLELCALAGIELAPYVNLRRWREAVAARPAFAATHPAA
jgi:GST-like protein